MIEKNKIIKEKIVNSLMKNGNKIKSDGILLKSIKKFQKSNLKDHAELIQIAIINSAPSIELKEIKRKKRKTVKYLTYVLSKKNRINKSIKNIMKNIRKENTIEESFLNSLIESSMQDSKIKKNNIESHKKAILKKKYANYRWFY